MKILTILTLCLLACGVSPDYGKSIPFSNTYMLEKGCIDGYELQVVKGKAPNVVLQWKNNEKVWFWLEGKSDAKKYLKKDGIKCTEESLKEGEELWFLSVFDEFEKPKFQ